MTKSWEEDQFNSYNEPWDLNPNTHQSQVFRIVDTTTVRVYVGMGNDLTKFAQVGDPYRIFYTFPPTLSSDNLFREEVPDPDTIGLKGASREAYIETFLLPVPYQQSLFHGIIISARVIRQKKI